MRYVGIDPGVYNGFAVWDKKKKCFSELVTLRFWPLIEKLKAMKGAEGRMVVILEDPNKNRPVFNRGLLGRQNLKVAQNVGGNKAYATLIKEYLEFENIDFTLVTPKTKKWSKDTFEQLTKVKLRTSQHARDAAKLVFQM